MNHFLFKRSVVIGIILLLTGAFFALSGESGKPSHSIVSGKVIPIEEPQQNVLNLDTLTWYGTIQGAIDAANPGERLFLEPMTFMENVNVWKPVLISGDLSRNQIVNGGSSGDTITITADGAAIRHLTVTNNGGYAGIKIESDSNLIFSNEIQGCKEGVYLASGSTANMVAQNVITNSLYEGILLYGSSGNTIVGNEIAGCPENGEMGLLIAASSNSNEIYSNTIRDNNNGIYLSSSTGNIIYHNNFVDNIANARMLGVCTGTQWHKIYPIGGNFWSDHSGSDDYHGTNQDILGGDNTGFNLIYFIDTPYYIPYGSGANDKYPLLLQWDITCNCCYTHQ
jgi:parallel beta-helix repeat protein